MRPMAKSDMGSRDTQLEEIAERARVRSRNVEESPPLACPDEFSSLQDYLENLDCSLLVERLKPHAEFLVGAAERARKRFRA